MSGAHGNLLPTVKPKPKMWISTGAGIHESREPGPGELDALWRDAQLAYSRGVLLAKREAIDAQLAELGLYMDPPRATNTPRYGNVAVVPYGVSFYKDRRGKVLPAEMDFIHRATCFFDVTPLELAATMWPHLCKNDKALKKAANNVRRKMTDLRKQNIAVR